LIFGLPGNPVSTYVCFELFVRPAIESLSGRSGCGLSGASARLECEHRQRGDRRTYFPAVHRIGKNGESLVRPVEWHGSADLHGLAGANALVAFEPGERTFHAGETVEVLLLEGSLVGHALRA
jgi:molybdopterin molybdotransferase